MPILSPDPQPFGASWDGHGVFFKIFSSTADHFELCLFATEDGPETARIPLARADDGVFSTYVPGLAPGQLYGYRADGPFAPERGLRFDHRCLLIDPYARAITGDLRWDQALLDEADHQPHDRATDRDTAPMMPKSMVVDPAFDWGEDRRPRTPWEETLIYEVHVKGMTKLHPAVPPELRGTFLGLAHDAVIEHLRSLGVTAVELLPIQHFVTEKHLAKKGLSNYWGYSPLGFFAPHAGYATAGRGEQVRELKTLVKTLHQAGIEVLVDVVLNHTAEGDHRGATLSWRGLDNAAYYLLADGDPARYVDWTGCGNTLNLAHSLTLELTIDALRYWADEMHVDGFRFDLASVLGRGADGGFSATAPLFARIAEDPVLSRLKLIAEPWDLGPDGYRLGRFPPGWAEWNDRYRDTLRSFWRGDPGRSAELASRLAGSRDLFPERAPQASINFFACHDGFTLRDLVSYERKHNAANGEGNRDGHEPNLSASWGVEGETVEPPILEKRQRVARAFLATLAVSWGVPMLGHGDELGRGQRGNNNAYCQDNELTWIDWRLGDRQRDLLAFTRRLFAWRRHGGWWRGGFPDDDTLTWLAPEGIAMTPELWQDGERRVLGLLIHPPNVSGETLVVLMNAASQGVSFALPPACRTIIWRHVLDTAKLSDLFDTETMVVTPPFALAPHSLKLLSGHES